jgi:hypothetical protein
MIQCAPVFYSEWSRHASIISEAGC